VLGPNRQIILISCGKVEPQDTTDVIGAYIEVKLPDDETPIESNRVVNRTDCCSDRILGCFLVLLERDRRGMRAWNFTDVNSSVGLQAYEISVSTDTSCAPRPCEEGVTFLFAFFFNF
jgi:hypothetical protein